MITVNEDIKRECLELLVEQNPMLDKDSILALYNDIEKSSRKSNTNEDLKYIIKNHKY
ncbi:MAG: hypothetical protein Q4F66_04430 [Clostridium sp.]|nr:hypothetical protein [Clostridium sp.]